MDDQQQRRQDDKRAPGQVDWSEVEGEALLGESSVVHFFRRRVEKAGKWTDVLSRQRLEFIQSEPEVFELRTLFTIPVADLTRAPVSAVARARNTLDGLERRIAKAERRLDDRHPAEPLQWEEGPDLLDMKCGANDLQVDVERALKSSLNFAQVRTADAVLAIQYIKYLINLAGKAHAARHSTAPTASSEES